MKDGAVNKLGLGWKCFHLSYSRAVEGYLQRRRSDFNHILHLEIHEFF